MLSYRDRTYCINKTCKRECSSRLTEKIIKEAEKLNLPIAVANYSCDEKEESEE